MKFRRTPRFDENYVRLDDKSQKAINKALKLLAHDFKYPSLRTKKMQGYERIFEASENMDIRITFHFEKPDTIVLRNCGHHDRTLNNP